MAALVTVRADGPVSTVTMDDGKVNALSLSMLTELDAALDQAESAGNAVVLTGREGIFSAGFDLGVLRAGGADAPAMLRAGFELAARLLAFPRPVVVAVTGHVVAMGLFLVSSGDYRIGSSGAFRVVANEVAIGLTMPHAAVAILRHRLTPTHLDRAVMLAETFSPDGAVGAGLLDEVVDPSALAETANAAATRFAELDREAHAASKLRVRADTLDALRAAIDDEFAERPGASR
jgi:enoyl-CoA hydratase